MRERFLVVVGVQPEKVSLLGRAGEKLIQWIQVNANSYDGVIAVVRKDQNNANFKQNGDTIANKTVSHLPYPTTDIIEVGGYDLDVRIFRKDIEYDIMGISSAASVLCIAMSMYSQGLKVNVLEKLCADRKGSKLHKAAFDIMNAYMPGCVK